MAATRQLGEARGRQQLFLVQVPEQLESLRQSSIIESSESSNRIEGVTAAPGRVAQLVVAHAPPRDRSEQEIAGYRDALQLVHDSHAHMAFVPNVILQLHSLLFRYLPNEGGRWKPVDNEIHERNASGEIVRVRFRATPAVATPQAMQTLADDYARAVQADGADPILVIPLAILDLLCIHPFRDGNGRIARLAMLLLLYHGDYRVGRYVSLERIIEESKETYYEALERSSIGWHDDRHDPHPWLDYFWGVLIRAYREFEDRVRSVQGSKTSQIRAAVMRRLGPFAISDIETDCPNISRDMVRLVLRQLKKENVIAPTGFGRSARWRRVDRS
ncbi:MAG TPA: Fic family protein [Vicinamibacterales bacterium]|nr:Fic family protein [Vicinamibacterales bacterium]